MICFKSDHDFIEMGLRASRILSSNTYAQMSYTMHEVIHISDEFFKQFPLKRISKQFLYSSVHCMTISINCRVFRSLDWGGREIYPKNSPKLPTGTHH